MAQHLSSSSLLPVSVLIVDDNQDFRELLRCVVEDAGYLVLEARDGLEALEILYRQSVPLIILTDHHMPRLDGPGLLGCVLEKPALLSGHAYLYMTAGTGEFPPPLQQLLAALDAPVLFKPFCIDELLSAIATAAQRL
jgi:CheY-like chemotaxis protein